MKKKLLSAAIILSALVGFSVSAQEPTTTDNQNCTEMTCKKDQKCNKKDKKDRKGNKDGKRGMKGQRPDLFKGIELTAEQKTQLEALRPACGENAPEKCEKMKEKKANCDSSVCVKTDKACKATDKACKAKCDKKDAKDCKAACDKKDAKDCKAACDSMKANCEKAKGHQHRQPRMNPAAREEFMGKVKEILTPEQYTIFLKNVEEAHANHGGKCPAEK